MAAFTNLMARHCIPSVCPVPALSVKKHPFAGADCQRLNVARAPFLTGFSRLLRDIKLVKNQDHLYKTHP